MRVVAGDPGAQEEGARNEGIRGMCESSALARATVLTPDIYLLMTRLTSIRLSWPLIRLSLHLCEIISRMASLVCLLELNENLSRPVSCVSLKFKPLARMKKAHFCSSIASTTSSMRDQNAGFRFHAPCQRFNATLMGRDDRRSPLQTQLHVTCTTCPSPEHCLAATSCSQTSTGMTLLDWALGDNAINGADVRAVGHLWAHTHSFRR